MPNYIQPVITELCARLPDCPADLIDLYAVLALTTGAATTLQQVHDTWAVWRNSTQPTHQSLVPFDQLTVGVQELDREYMQAIRDVAAAVAR